jgi:hypothetical protein
LIGEDGIREALTTVFHEKALAPEGDTTHGDLFKDYTKWADKTGKFMDKKKELDDFLKKSNLTPEEAEKVRGVADLQERKDKIADILTQKGLGPEKDKRVWFRKKKVWSEEQLTAINETADEMADGLKADGSPTKWSDMGKKLSLYGKQAEKAQKQIIERMGIVLSEDGTKEIGRILMSEAKPKETAMSFDEVRKGIASAKNSDNIRSEFLAYAEDDFGDFVDAGPYDLGDLTSQGRAVDQFFGGFKGRMIAKAKERGGFWGAVYEVIVGSFLDEFLPELKKQTSVDKQNKKLSIKKKK